MDDSQLYRKTERAPARAKTMAALKPSRTKSQYNSTTGSTRLTKTTLQASSRDRGDFASPGARPTADRSNLRTSNQTSSDNEKSTEQFSESGTTISSLSFESRVWAANRRRNTASKPYNKANTYESSESDSALGESINPEQKDEVDPKQKSRKKKLRTGRADSTSDSDNSLSSLSGDSKGKNSENTDQNEKVVEKADSEHGSDSSFSQAALKTNTEELKGVTTDLRKPQTESKYGRQEGHDNHHKKEPHVPSENKRHVQGAHSSFETSGSGNDNLLTKTALRTVNPVSESDGDKAQGSDSNSNSNSDPGGKTQSENTGSSESGANEQQSDNSDPGEKRKASSELQEDAPAKKLRTDSEAAHTGGWDTSDLSRSQEQQKLVSSAPPLGNREMSVLLAAASEMEQMEVNKDLASAKPSSARNSAEQGPARSIMASPPPRKPDPSPAVSELASKRTYNRQNAARARKRFKQKLDELQSRVQTLQGETQAIKMSNNELEIQMQQLAEENKRLVENHEQLTLDYMQSAQQVEDHDSHGDSRIAAKFPLTAVALPDSLRDAKVPSNSWTPAQSPAQASLLAASRSTPYVQPQMMEQSTVASAPTLQAPQESPSIDKSQSPEVLQLLLTLVSADPQGFLQLLQGGGFR